MHPDINDYTLTIRLGNGRELEYAVHDTRDGVDTARTWSNDPRSWGGSFSITNPAGVEVYSGTFFG